MKLRVYVDRLGKEPFYDWLHSLKDSVARMRIRRRLDRIELGNLGVQKSVGDGVYELKFFFGSGYRVYYALYGETVVFKSTI